MEKFPSNKRKKTIIITIIVMYAFAVVALFLFFLHTQNAANIKRCETIEALLMRDEAFEEEYGEVESVTYDGWRVFGKALRGLDDVEIEIKCIVKNTQGEEFRFLVVFDFLFDKIISYSLIS